MENNWKKDPLLDPQFLYNLDIQRQKEIYAKIISLDFDEKPIEEITGKITQGNINIDGNSSVRRSCSLTVVANELNIHDFYWGLNTKIKIYTGLKNDIDDQYPEIIWFLQGTYILTSFNTSQNTSQYQISIQGKDKMCLLNGDIGGAITALTVDFGKIEIINENGFSTIEDLPLKQIIMEGVHEYAKEPFQNIVINDLDDCGIELMEYRGDQNMYFIVDLITNEINNMTLDENQSYDFYQLFNKNTGRYSDWIQGPITIKEIVQKNEQGIDGYSFDTRIDYLDIQPNPIKVGTQVEDEIVAHTIIKGEYGDAIGYRETDLTYPGDLIGKVGSSFCNDVLDPIKNLLGNFEYFYDKDGKFIFQKKKTYVNSSWNNIKENEEKETYAENNMLTSAYTYSFENGLLVTSFENKPDLLNLRNDFSIWGTRTGINSNSKIPVHMRYAIDQKPKYYKTLDEATYITKEYLEELSQEETIVTRNSFRTAILPECLNKDWWEIEDWANYYQYLTGKIPDQRLSSYWTAYTTLNIEEYFPYTSRWQNWERHPIFLFDIDQNGRYVNLGHNPSFSSTEEAFLEAMNKPNTGCYHTYKDLLNNKKQRNYTTYFYKPQLPEEDMTEEVKEKIDLMNYNVVDWREILYQMAADHSKHYHEKDFLRKVAKNNNELYPEGYTGYELYYTDIYSFWRELYNPDYKGTYTVAYVTRSSYEEAPANTYFWYENCESALFSENTDYYIKTSYETYQYRKITKEQFLLNRNNYYYIRSNQGNGVPYFDKDLIYYTKSLDDFFPNNEDKNACWAKNIIDYPNGLNFWFDFLDAKGGNISKYNVRNLGNRPKSVNDNNVKAIYFRDTPTVIFVNSTISAQELKIQKDLKPGYTFLRLPEYMDNLFKISTQGKSAKDVLDEFLYNYTHCTESITINSIPIYYLEPNTRIFVTDNNSGINGEYIVNKITLPLTHNGTMQISAIKAVERLY